MNFKDLKEEIIGYANQTFSEMYTKIFQQYWNDGRYTANMARNYNHSDPKNGVYQALIPTMMSPEHGMNYSSIIIKVLPEISQEQAKTEAEKLHQQSVKPCGRLDSELIVLVALQRRGWTRGFKQVKNDKGGYLTAIFIATDKEITSTNELWRKLLEKVIIPFYEKRIHRFLEDFNLTHDEDSRPLSITQLYYKGTSIIESISFTHGVFVKSMSHLINWLHCKLSWFLEQFKMVVATRQVEKKMLEHCKPLQLKLRMQSKRQLIMSLQKSLAADAKMSDLLQHNKFLNEKDLTVNEKDRGLLLLESLARR